MIWIKSWGSDKASMKTGISIQSDDQHVFWLIINSPFLRKYILVLVQTELIRCTISESDIGFFCLANSVTTNNKKLY